MILKILFDHINGIPTVGVFNETLETKGVESRIWLKKPAETIGKTKFESKYNEDTFSLPIR